MLSSLEKVKVSVIIPVYNAEGYIRECLDSVICQSLKELEIICVDDGSTDETPSILDEYSKKDSRITVLHQSNSYSGVARNNGLAIAKGEYVHFLDADDYVDKSAYETLYAIASANKLDYIKFCSQPMGEFIDAKTVKYYSLGILSNNEFNCVTSFYDKPYKSARVNVASWCALYSRALLTDNQIAFPNYRCAQDREFNVKTLVYSQRCMYLDKSFVFHRVENGGSSIDTRKKYFGNIVDSYNGIVSFVKKSNLPLKHKIIIRYCEFRDLVYWFLRCKIS